MSIILTRNSVLWYLTISEKLSETIITWLMEINRLRLLLVSLRPHYEPNMNSNQTWASHRLFDPSQVKNIIWKYQVKSSRVIVVIWKFQVKSSQITSKNLQVEVEIQVKSSHFLTWNKSNQIQVKLSHFSAWNKSKRI